MSNAWQTRAHGTLLPLLYLTICPVHSMNQQPLKAQLESRHSSEWVVKLGLYFDIGAESKQDPSLHSTRSTLI